MMMNALVQRFVAVGTGGPGRRAVSLRWSGINDVRRMMSTTTTAGRIEDVKKEV